MIELHCTYDPETRNAPLADGYKVQGVIHWVSACHAVPTEVRLYDRSFSIEDPGSEEDYIKYFTCPIYIEHLFPCLKRKMKNLYWLIIPQAMRRNIPIYPAYLQYILHS